MIKIPNSISIANLPTRIENLKGLSEELQKNIFIKRDDFTGCEVSGNKVRKLEYSVKDAIDKGCNTLITCGGIQSNHARATAAVAARLGLKSILVLRSNETPKIDGNYLLDEILGSEV
ncbi:MAG: pyridoxal-phosphate dependent enzyme, partial [Cetobacterium sp.]